MKRILFLLVLMIPVIFPVFGQSMVYPVQVNVNLLPPYSLYLSDYVSGSRDRLIVTLLNRDVQYPSMPVRLRLTVKGNGFSVQTRPYAAVTPLVLEPNVPYRLTISDLQPYFDTRNLSAQGLGGDSYLKGGRLPEGMIEFGIEVLEYGTGKLLSQKGIGTAWLVLQKPPQLSLPFDGEVIPWREPLNLLFQWTPQHSAVGRVEYELVIKELWDNGLAAESAFAYSPEIFRERISSTGYLYGPQSPPLEAGHRYAWAVQVVAKDGADDVSIFENEGRSVVRSFRIDRNCPVPAQIKAGAERGYIAVEWEGAPEHIGYMVSYRLSGSEEWTDVRSTFPSAMLSGVRPGNTYEYRVAGFCEPEVPTYNNTTASITLPSEDTARMRSCGLLRPVDLSNQQPLEELSAGDQFMAGDFPVTVTEVTGSQGYYTGTGSVNVPFLAGAKFKVAFDNIFLNTDRRMVRGTVNTVYDATESGITNLDDIFVGGSETGKVMAGITKTDLSADFVIDKDADIYFDESENQIIVKGDDGQVIGYIDVGEAGMEREEAGGNNGNEPSVFPMTIKDKEGNLYRVDKAPEDVLPEGEEAGGNTGQATARPPKKLVVTPLGKSGEKLSTDEVNLKHLDSDVGEVVFTDVEGSRYAFDGWKDVYARSILIRQKYEQIGSSYHVASKLIPPGKSDRVGAEIRLKDQSVDPEKVVFRTAQGTEFQVESFDRKKGRYVLTLVGGATNDGQEVYALYPKAGGGYYNLGKLLVVSYPEYKFRVKIVPLLRDFGGDFPSLKSTLESVYSRVGIGCEVTLDAYFEYADPLLFDKGSGLLSAYNGKMKALNEAYASVRGVEKEVSYIFITGYSGGSGKRDFSGFMPLNTQFGYVSRYDFRSLDKFCIAVAHELAHGRFSLRHPFDSSLGLDEGDVSENLMDYRNGLELSKWQWDVMHDPGVVVRLFERDQDGALKGAFYDGIALTPLVDYKYHYNFGDIYSVEAKSGELTCGRYNLTAHYNTDHDNTKKLSYYLAWCEVLKDGTTQYRQDYYIGANRLNEFQTKVENYSSAADIFFMNGVPAENMLRVLCGVEIGDLSEVLGGLGDMWGDALLDPMWWIDIVNGSVSPKFLKPAGKFMGSFIRGLSDGAISLLNKTGRLGYKIKHIAGEVALYTNLEIEIARFNSRGILRPLHWGEAIGEKVLSLEDDIRFLKDGKEFSGRLVLYRNNATCVWVLPKFVVGDKIAEIAIERIKIGRNNKIAIIGRSMGNANMKGVKDAYMDLIQRGYENVEIFDPLSLSDDWLNSFQLAEREMRKLSTQLGRYLNNKELANTKMFQLNKKWAQKLVEENYTVIDLGDIPLKNDSYNGFSAFYAIEKKTIFGK